MLKTPLRSAEGAGVARVHAGMVAHGVPGWAAPRWGCHSGSGGGWLRAGCEAGFPAVSKIQAPKQHLEKLLVLAVSSPLGQVPRMLPRPFLERENAVRQLRNFPDAFYLFCFIFERPSAGGLDLTDRSWQEQHIFLRESCSSATSIYCSSAASGVIPPPKSGTPQRPGGPWPARSP